MNNTLDFPVDRTLKTILIAMINSTLIDYKTYLPYCDSKILELDKPPDWLLNLAMNSNAYNDGFYCVPTKEYPILKDFDFSDLMVACYYLKYRYKKIYWDRFLILSGNYLDGFSGKFYCDDFYILLNKFNDNNTILSQQEVYINYMFEKEISFMDSYYRYFQAFYNENY